MAVRIVQLGTARRRGEGLRLGTVRRPPRGMPKAEYAQQDWFDVWLPNLSPSAALMRRTNILNDRSAWKGFERSFRSELATPDAAHLLDALAALSHQTDFSVGCYCNDERYCHRSILRAELEKRGASIA